MYNLYWFQIDPSFEPYAKPWQRLSGREMCYVWSEMPYRETDFLEFSQNWDVEVKGNCGRGEMAERSLSLYNLLKWCYCKFVFSSSQLYGVLSSWPSTSLQFASFTRPDHWNTLLKLFPYTDKWFLRLLDWLTLHVICQSIHLLSIPLRWTHVPSPWLSPQPWWQEIMCLTCPITNFLIETKLFHFLLYLNAILACSLL